MASIKSIGRFFLFIAAGLVTIVVGSFMLRGNMHMWDSKKDSEERG